MTVQSRRLPAETGAGASIDRTQSIEFTFDGKVYQGCQGDTLASALLANDVHLLGRSFKYHRPRGLLSMGSEEPNALMELRTGARKEPNTRATMIELYAGLIAKSQNRFPSLAVDVMSVNQLLSPFLTAGFYYKTFMWPASLWESVYEKIIRRAAGLGSASTEMDPDHYEHAHYHCDVLIVGAGPTGLSAALGAANTGARVLLVEERSTCGGALSFAQDVIDDVPAAQWVSDTLDKLKSMDNVDLMTRTTLFGYYDGNVLAALERVSDHLAVPDAHQPRQRLWTIRAGEVVIAAGAHERPMLFPNNDRPGVMLNTAIRTLVDRYGVAPGASIALCTTNDDAYKTADLLLTNGIEITAICDARPDPSPAAKAIMERGVAVNLATVPSKALGGRRVSGLIMSDLSGANRREITCDCIGVSGGYSPDVHLSSQTGASPVWHEALQGFLPAPPIRPERSAGACNGSYALADCLREGYDAGIDAAVAAGFTAGSQSSPSATVEAGEKTFAALWQCPGPGKTFVDFQNDVTAEDIRLAHQEGYVSVEHTKRYTTLGMATDQGKTANVNGIAVLAQSRNQSIQDVGTTRFRPPYSPVAIAAFAGHERGKEFQPVRRTAMHECHARIGAVFVEAGLWLRPQYYPQPGEDVMDAIYRESEQVRKTVGICDVSTLGKIEIFGEDASEFLNRLYINGWSTLQPGKARYGLMLREDGYVYDDGTTSMLADNHYFMTTTTANAAGVLAHMEHASQVLWPEMDVHFCSATEQWCGVAVAGPNARALMNDVFGEAFVIDNDSIPFMGVREFRWRGIQTRIFRISFSGEHAYEVNVPWGHGETLWNALFDIGQSHEVIPYGTEALSVLRIEKGHVAGNELDGRTTPVDMGLGRMMSTKKHFIGQPLSGREGFVEADRPTLVGLKLLGDADRLRGGAHLVDDVQVADGRNSQGWVTSVAHSPTEQCWIGLGYLKGGLDRVGDTMTAYYPLKGEKARVEVCHPIFFDPDGERIRG